MQARVLAPLFVTLLYMGMVFALLWYGKISSDAGLALLAAAGGAWLPSPLQTRQGERATDRVADALPAHLADPTPHEPPRVPAPWGTKPDP